MRKEFRGFYPPTDDELERLWRGDVILDANVLLNFYRYGPATVSNLFNVLEALKAQLWLPHQAAAEFHRNRIAVMSAQPKAYEELDKIIKDLRNRLVAAIRGKSRHPEIDAGRLEEVATAAIDSVEKELNTQLQASSPPNPADLSMDPILERITRLSSTGVGSAFTENELATLRREADVRYKESIPPGYRDASKEGDRRYGDFIIWSEIIRRAQNEQRPVLFITDDLKEDWWQRSSGHTLGPQPALVQEIWERSNQLFYMYEPRKFIDEASRRLSITIDSSTLGEVSQVSKEGEYADRVSELERMEDEHTVRRLLRSEHTERSILHAQHVLDLERKKRALDKRISTLHAGLFDVDDATEFGAFRGEMSRLSLFEKQTDLDVALMESERLRAEIEQARSAHLRAEREEEESEVIRRELRRLHERRVRSVDESSK